MLRRYLLAGLLTCSLCGRRMESAWSNGKAAYRCRHGRTSAMAPDPARPKNTYVREDRLLPHLPALHLLLTSPATRARRRTRAGADVKATAAPGEVIGYLRKHEITLTWNPAAAALQARPPDRQDRHRDSTLARAAKALIRGTERKLGTPIARRWPKPARRGRSGVPENRRIWGITVSEGDLNPLGGGTSPNRGSITSPK